MLRVLPLESTPNGGQPSRLIPRAVWRQLLLSPPLPTSSRVVFCGASSLENARTLAALPLDLCVLCDDPRDVLTLRGELPECDIYASANAFERIPPRSVDLLVLQDATAFDANLFDSSVRQQTAGWLSLLKPQARLVFLQREDEGFGHHPDCWVRHLACFPGRIEQRETWDSLLDWSRWELFGPREHRPTTHLVSIRIPNEPLSPDDWRDYARHGLLTSQRSCCLAASAVAQPVRIRRAA